MLGRHDGAAGRWFDAHYRALQERLGPFDLLSRDAAGLAAADWVILRQANERLQAATRARESGRGRRPSASTVRALEKRVGLAQQSYDLALRRLEELSASRPRSESPIAAFSRALTEGER